MTKATEGFNKTLPEIEARADLTSLEKRLFTKLLHYCLYYRRESCHPSQERLAEELGASESGIKRATLGLENANLIRTSVVNEGFKRVKTYFIRIELVNAMARSRLHPDEA